MIIKMANEGDKTAGGINEGSLQLAFPFPPAKYFKKYTEANLKLRIWPSPPRPLNGMYSTFGDIYEANEEIIRPLEAQGIPRLYSAEDNSDILAEMKKINHSILVSFMELLDTLTDAPSQEERELKLDDINILFINLHHLINEFRPHQARETLRLMLQKQKLQRQETAERLSKHIDKAKAILRNIQSNIHGKVPLVTTAEYEHQNENDPVTNDIEMKDEHHSCDKITSENLNMKIMCDLVDQIT